MAKPKVKCPACGKADVDGRHTSKCGKKRPPKGARAKPAAASGLPADPVATAVQVLKDLAAAVYAEADRLRKKAQRVEEIVEEVGRL